MHPLQLHREKYQRDALAHAVREYILLGRIPCWSRYDSQAIYLLVDDVIQAAHDQTNYGDFNPERQRIWLEAPLRREQRERSLRAIATSDETPAMLRVIIEYELWDTQGIVPPREDLEDVGVDL